MKGQKISERYQVIKSIGEGGMANVYLAYDTILDRNVAIKLLRGDLASDEKFVHRFQREALSASSLNHPNIVEVYDVGEDGGDYYIVMEYIEGKHLKDLIKKRGKLTTSEVVDIMLQITDGMSIAHDSYIIHRDIKPQNIMILENGLVKITDFGIAMAMNATQLTQTNSVMGSVHYLPPEQANGNGSSLQSDIYSMGIVMYELLTGKLPFRGDNAVEIALKHLRESMPDIKEELPTIPNSIANIILKATAKNPKNRYTDAREMHEDLKTCMNDERIKEARVVFKYSENNFDNTKVSKMLKETKKESTGEDPIAKQITKNDLKKQNKLLITLASIFTGLVVIITSVVVLIPVITNQKEISVPDVTNMTVTEAIQKLQDSGFVVNDEQQEQASSEIPEGHIIKTNPAAKSKRTKNTTITLFVSMGDTKITLENYINKNYLEVKGALEAQGLQVLIEKKDVDNEDDKYKDGEIIEQSVKPGEKLSVGDTLTLYIPNVISKYPDFTDGSYSIEEIQAFCEEYGIKLKINEIVTTEYEDGKIIKQDKPKDFTIRAGVTLTIDVAKNDSAMDTPIECDDLLHELGQC